MAQDVLQRGARKLLGAGGPEQLTTINGSSRAQVGSVSFQLDGGNNTAGLRGTGNPAPNPEAIQEFRVLTNSYAAEYGRYQAGIVDVVTKSGTNQFHGAVYEFFRNESLNAARWTPPGVASAKDPLDRKLDAEPSFWRSHEPNPLGPAASARHQF